MRVFTFFVVFSCLILLIDGDDVEESLIVDEPNVNEFYFADDDDLEQFCNTKSSQQHDFQLPQSSSSTRTNLNRFNPTIESKLIDYAIKCKRISSVFFLFSQETNLNHYFYIPAKRHLYIIYSLIGKSSMQREIILHNLKHKYGLVNRKF